MEICGIRRKAKEGFGVNEVISKPIETKTISDWRASLNRSEAKHWIARNRFYSFQIQKRWPRSIAIESSLTEIK